MEGLSNGEEQDVHACAGFAGKPRGAIHKAKGDLRISAIHRVHSPDGLRIIGTPVRMVSGLTAHHGEGDDDVTSCKAKCRPWSALGHGRHGVVPWY
jgi:hypothetical protein